MAEQHDPGNPSCTCIVCEWRRRREAYDREQAIHKAPYTQREEIADAMESGDGVTYFTHECQ